MVDDPTNPPPAVDIERLAEKIALLSSSQQNTIEAAIDAIARFDEIPDQYWDAILSFARVCERLPGDMRVRFIDDVEKMLAKQSS